MMMMMAHPPHLLNNNIVHVFVLLYNNKTKQKHLCLCTSVALSRVSLTKQLARKSKSIQYKLTRCLLFTILF